MTSISIPGTRTQIPPDWDAERRREYAALGIITERVWRSGVEITSRLHLAHFAHWRHVTGRTEPVTRNLALERMDEQQRRWA